MSTESQKTRTLKIGVVPEHFSLPFHLGRDRGLNKLKGRDGDTVTWDIVEHPRGTASMCADLRNGSIDLAIALTEGLVSDIAKSGSQDFTIIGTYTVSPLEWALAAAADATNIQSVQDLKGKVFGVSRFGSGSHIMSYLLCDREGWVHLDDANANEQVCPVQFRPTGGLSDLVHATRISTSNDPSLQQEREQKGISCFLWETWMLKQFVERGELKYVGSIKTPWPCFMIAARKELLTSVASEGTDSIVHQLLSSIRACCRLFSEEREQSIERVSKECHLSVEDAQKWFSSVEFACRPESQKVKKEVIKHTLDVLVKTKALIHPANEKIDKDYTHKFYTKGYIV